jgi:hypothetical protein
MRRPTSLPEHEGGHRRRRRPPSFSADRGQPLPTGVGTRGSSEVT